jgi:hypothetical protein
VEVLDQLDAVIDADRGRLPDLVLVQALSDLDAFAARLRQALAGAFAESHGRDRRPWTPL